jgi:hypothetical protein
MTSSNKVAHYRGQQGSSKNNANDSCHGNCALFWMPDVDEATSEKSNGCHTGNSTEESTDENRLQVLSYCYGDAEESEKRHAGNHGLSSSKLFGYGAPKWWSNGIALDCKGISRSIETGRSPCQKKPWFDQLTTTNRLTPRVTTSVPT